MRLAKPSSLKLWWIGFHRGMDGLPAPPGSSSSRAMDDVLRRISHENGSWGAGLLFISPLGVHMRYVIRIHFATSNNVAEYEALVNGLKIAIELGVRRLDVRGDSQLVINQVMKASSCHDPKMEAYYKEVRRLEDKFHGLELVHIARRYNEVADELAKITSTRGTVPPDTSLPSTWARGLVSKPLLPSKSMPSKRY